MPSNYWSDDPYWSGNLRTDLRLHENAKLPNPKVLEDLSDQLLLVCERLLKLGNWNAAYNILSETLQDARNSLDHAYSKLKSAAEMIEEARSFK
jgi:hypothetical protein